MGRTKYWTQKDKEHGKNAFNFPACFRTMCQHWRHVVVFKLNATIQGKPINLMIQNSYKVEAVPLDPLPGHITDKKWGPYIGFEKHPVTLLPCKNLEAYTMMQVLGRTGCPRCHLPQPTLLEPPHYPIAFGSYLDFDACPPSHQSRYNNNRWLFVRGLAPKGCVSDARLSNMVQNVVSLEKRYPGSTARPRQLSSIKGNSAFLPGVRAA